MNWNRSTRLRHICDHALGLVIGAILVKLAVSAVRAEGPRVNRAVLVGGLTGLMLAPAIRRVRSSRSNLGGTT